MKIGFIGLGRMGYNMALNLLEHKHNIVAYDINPEAAKKLARKGAKPAYSIKELAEKLPRPRIVWLMIPAGKPVDNALKKLAPLLNRGDIVIDGGNSFYKDSIKRHSKLKRKGINFLDCGTSGGITGARHGACMMVGGERNIFRKVERLFRDMCVKDGYGYMGKPGAGHFVKMVHNGIEYGMMGALAEGFNAIEGQKQRFSINLKEVAKVYAHGSIIEGRLASLLWDSFRTPGYLSRISCIVPKGETEEEMRYLEKLSGMPILYQARLMRVKSRKHKVCGKLVAALRNQFGGHKVLKK